MLHKDIAPATLDRRTGKPLHTDESRRPTLPRPVVRCELFSGWGPKL